MTTQEFKRIKELLNQWEKDSKSRQASIDSEINEFGRGYQTAAAAIRMSDCMEMLKLLEDFSSCLTMDDIMGRLSKFLDREEAKHKEASEDERKFMEYEAEQFRRREAHFKDKP